jgi:YVTN family beta-propeller protein
VTRTSLAVRAVAAAGAIGMAFACGPSGSVVRAAPIPQTHSGPLAVSPDGSLLFVANPDADEVSILALPSRSIQAEVLLSGASPKVDPATQRFDPAVYPRAVAVDPTGKTLYVTGQRSGMLYAVDVASGAVAGSVAVCSEPVGALVSADAAAVYVACSQDDEVAEVDAATLTVTSTETTPRKPWALAWSADGSLVTTHFLGPGVSVLSTGPLALQSTWAVPDIPSPSDPDVPHGQVRGLYDVAPRPFSRELWTSHLMLGIDTPQPALAFDDTVFPSVSILDGTLGTPLARLSVQPADGAFGSGGAFGDVVSGPRSLAFSDDGKYAFVTDTDSEDLLVIDATARVEASLVRPLPGHMPEGLVYAHGEIYVQERNTLDIVAFKATESSTAGIAVVQDGPAFATLASDPMPATLRLGQKLFYSANSDDEPLTQNHWVACATCHLEGRSDAVTWRFAQGPRDTPTNAGGTLDTGFLFRTADRTKVQDYWKTIDVEQGGDFAPDDAAQAPLLDAIAAYVNYAIPVPVPPSTDATHRISGSELAALRATGQNVFMQVGCATCHSGPARTDSGAGNPSLDLAGPLVSTMTNGGVLLHDVGTCVTSGPWPDVAHQSIDGQPRPSCAFDTPALRGITDSAPYLHDGSAPTLEAVLPLMLAASGATPTALSASDQTALLEYLRGL